MVDYRKFRLNRLNSPEFSHLKLLLYWPAYGLVFWILERALNLDYHVVECDFDSVIPFCEYFVLPYYFWFAYIVGMLIYTLLFDVQFFRRFMYFIMITYTITSIIYIIYPTMQTLRPGSFERDNICTRIISLLYTFDTNTNVCPSLHVTGSMAVFFTAWHTKRFSTWYWRLIFSVATVFISISTVFLKQHSIIDIVAALILCAVAYPIAFYVKKSKPSQFEPSYTVSSAEYSNKS